MALDGTVLADRYLLGRTRAWKALTSWRQSLADVAVGFEPLAESPDGYLGRAFHDRSTVPPTRCVMVYVTGYLAEDLETVLHELAHHSVGCGAEHRAPWMHRLAEAVEEATGIAAPEWRDLEDAENGTQLYDCRVIAHLVAWLDQTGRARRFREAGIRLWKYDERADVAA